MISHYNRVYDLDECSILHGNVHFSSSTSKKYKKWHNFTVRNWIGRLLQKLIPSATGTPWLSGESDWTERSSPCQRGVWFLRTSSTLVRKFISKPVQLSKSELLPEKVISCYCICWPFLVVCTVCILSKLSNYFSVLYTLCSGKYFLVLKIFLLWSFLTHPPPRSVTQLLFYSSLGAISKVHSYENTWDASFCE